MARDFRSQQIRTSTLIASGGLGGSGKPNLGLLVYSSSAASDFSGGRSDNNMLQNVGSDVWLFVSGTINPTGSNFLGPPDRPANRTDGVTLFGGDVVVSGTFYAESVVMEVDQITTGSLLVSGSLFVSQSLTVDDFISGSIFQTAQGLSYIQAGSNITVTSASNGQIIIASTAGVGTGDSDKTAQYLVLAATSSLTDERVFTAGTGLDSTDAGAGNAFTLAIDDDVVATVSGTQFSGGIVVNEAGGSAATDDFRVETNNKTHAIFADASTDQVLILSGGGELDDNEALYTDTALFVSGARNSRGSSDTVKGASLFGGDLVVSGSIFAVGKGSGANVLASTPSGFVQIANDPSFPGIAISGSTSQLPRIRLGVGGGTANSRSSQVSLEYFSASFGGALRTYLNDGGRSQYAIIERDNAAGTTRWNNILLYSASVSSLDQSYLLLLSSTLDPRGSGGESPDPMTFTDANFYVSGTMGAKGGLNRGVAVFGGDLVASGALIVNPSNENLTTRIFNSQAGSAVFKVSSDGVIINEAGAAANDFRVESDSNSHMLFVDAGNDRLGIGTVGSNPVTTVHIKDSAPTLRIQRSSNSEDSTLDFAAAAGAVGAVMHLSGTNDLVFKTHNGSTPEEMFRIGSHYGSLNRQIIFLSGSGMGADAMQPKEATDIAFFVSGSKRSQGTSNKGTAVFGGDTVVSGAIYVGGPSTSGDNTAGHIVFESKQDKKIRFHGAGIDILGGTGGIGAGGTHYFVTVNDGTSGPKEVTINALSEDIDFKVRSDVGTALKSHAATHQLSLGDGNEPAKDTFLFISGGIGSRNSSTVSGSAVFGGDLIVSGGLTVFGADTFGSISGSIHRTSEGKSYLQAGPNITITSASNGQVLISASTGGSVTAVSGSTSVSNTTQIDFEKLALLTNLGGGVVALTGTIGDANDGDYTDGLFTNFAANTPIGTAINKINEVLAFLAPAEAPNLSSINSADTGTTARLSFGASNDLTSESPSYVTVGAGAGLGAAVDIQGLYTVTTSSNNIRLGIFDGTTVINGTVADNVSANTHNGGTINHSGSVFSDAELGVLKLEVNGSVKRTLDLSNTSIGSGVPGNGGQNSLNANSSGFTSISQTGSAVQANGQEFGLFKHRSANYQVGTADQRDGWNYARVIHSASDGDERITNFVEWVNDSQGSAIDITNHRIANPVLSGSKFISGIQYATGAQAEYLTEINNFYEHVHAINAISFTTTNTTIANQNVPACTSHDQVIRLTASFDLDVDKIQGGSMAGGQVAVNFSLSHPIKANLSNTGSVLSDRWLVYSASQLATNQFEDFVYEDFRIISASYDTQASVIHTDQKWNPQLHLTSSETGQGDGLQVFSGSLVAPRNSFNGGNFTAGAFGTGQAYTDNQPNYSGLSSGLKTYYRYFRNETGAIARDFDLFITGVSTNIVPRGTSIENSSSDIRVLAKLPEETGWLDLGQSFAFNTGSDDAGGRIGSLASSIGSGGGVLTNHMSFGTASVANNDYICIKIEADADWTGRLDGWNVFFPAVASDAVAAAPDVNELHISTVGGQTGKLAFGSTRNDCTSSAGSAIAGPYINVTGSDSSQGFQANLDINGAVTLSTNTNSNKRYGIFPGTGSITGPINDDTSASGNAFTNDSFGDAHTGSLKLYVNNEDTPIHTLDLNHFLGNGNPGSGDASSLNADGSGFTNVSVAAVGKDSDNLEDFRRHYRTANFLVSSASQQNGWNWARVVHSIHEASDRNTTYVEWVVDSNTGSIAIPSASVGPAGGNGEYYRQSGVVYFNTANSPPASGTISCLIRDAYTNVYSENADAIKLTDLANVSVSSFLVSGDGINTTSDSSLTNNGTELPALKTNVFRPQETLLLVTASIAYTGGQSLPGDGTPFSALTSVDAQYKWNAFHPLNNPAGTNVITLPNWLVYSGTAGSSNVNTKEDFRGEFFRMASGSYDAQNEVTGTWDSSQSLAGADAYHNTGMLVYGNDGTRGFLVSPKHSGLPNGGNFTASQTLAGPGLDGQILNVNYSGVTGIRDFYRSFLNNDSSDRAVISFTVKGDATLVARSGANQGSLGSNSNVHIDVKIPGKTGWMDTQKAFDGTITDGGGALNGSRDANIDSAGATNQINFGATNVAGTTSGAEKVMFRVVANANWTGYIQEISVDFSP